MSTKRERRTRNREYAARDHSNGVNRLDFTQRPANDFHLFHMELNQARGGRTVFRSKWWDVVEEKKGKRIVERSAQYRRPNPQLAKGKAAA